MTTTVAFYFEDTTHNTSSGWPDATMERWVMNARAGGIDHLCMIDKTTFHIGQYYQHIDAKTNFERYLSLEELEQAKPDAIFIYIAASTYITNAGIQDNSLIGFVHPDAINNDVVYVIGPDSKDIPTAGREDKIWLSIPAVPGNPFWAEEAAGLVIYDRYVKSL